MSLLKYLLLFPIFLIPNNSYAEPFLLPKNIKNTLQKACLTADAFILNAVRQQMLLIHPNMKSGILDYTSGDCKNDKEEKVENIPAKEEKKHERPWQAWVDAGFSIATGNTEESNMNINTKVEHDIEFWKNTLKINAKSQRESQITTSEEYRMSVSSRYKWKEKDYFFAEGEYVNDRFSGYEYRISETIGYGHIFKKDKYILLEAEISTGARHSKLTDNTNENSLLQKIAGRLNKEITKNMSFEQEIGISIGQNTTITRSSTAVKTRLIDQLYLKFGIDVEYISDVPEGTNDTDTLTTLNLGYHF